MCCESFVSYQELEVCGLTQAALKRYADDISATRDRVEYRADQTFHLLKEAPLRYRNRHRRPMNGGSANGGAASTTQHSSSNAAVAKKDDEIEIIDIDD